MAIYMKPVKTFVKPTKKQFEIDFTRQNAVKIAKNTAKTTQDAAMTPQDAPRRPQDAAKTPPKPSQDDVQENVERTAPEKNAR